MALIFIFGPKFALASLLYLQPNQPASFVTAGDSVPNASLVGSFIASSDMILASSSVIQAVVQNDSNYCQGSASMYLLISDSSSSQSGSYGTFIFTPTSDRLSSVQIASIIPSSYDSLISGNTYYFRLHSQCSGADYLIGGESISGYFYFSGYLSTESINTTESKIYNFSYSTTTELAHIEGFWKATTTPGITERLSFYQESSLGQEDFVQVYATTTGFFSYDFPFRGSSYTTTGTTTAPLLSEFTLNARLDQYGPIVSFTQTDILPLDATSTSISGLNYGVNDYSTSTRNLLLYPEYECGITSMTGCVKNAFIWAFYPTQDSLNQYNNFLQLMQNKAPFGYFYSIKGSLSGISSTSTSIFNITIPANLKQFIFDPFDIAIASILWFFGSIHIYKRLKDVDI